MQSGRRWFAITLVIVVGVLVAGWMVTLRLTADARALLHLLPPDADAYVVIDLDILQSNPAVKRLLADPPNVAPAEEYRQMLQESGFRYQDDLRQLAAAKMGQDWVGVAVVDVERQRFTSYLESQRAVKSELNGRTVYSFGSERPFRLAFLDDRQIVFTIGADPTNLPATPSGYFPANLPAYLKDVLDRSANPSARSAQDDLQSSGLLAGYPEGSGLWIVGRVERLIAAGTAAPGIGPFQLGSDWWAGSKTMLLSVISSPLHLDVHLDNQCEDAASAQRMAGAFKALLVILKAVQPPENDTSRTNYTPLLEAVTILQADKSVLLDWKWNPSMLALLVDGKL